MQRVLPTTAVLAWVLIQVPVVLCGCGGAPALSALIGIQGSGCGQAAVAHHHGPDQGCSHTHPGCGCHGHDHEHEHGEHDAHQVLQTQSTVSGASAELPPLALTPFDASGVGVALTASEPAPERSEAREPPPTERRPVAAADRLLV